MSSNYFSSRFYVIDRLENKISCVFPLFLNCLSIPFFFFGGDFCNMLILPKWHQLPDSAFDIMGAYEEKTANWMEA